jgi:hypothetical protein
MTQSLPLTLYPAKLKVWLCLVGALAFTALGAWMALSGERSGWFLGCFSAMGIPVFLGTLLPGATYVKVSEDGLECCSLFKKTKYRWNDIQGVGTYSLQYNGIPSGTFVGINLSPECPTAPRFRGRATTGFDTFLPNARMDAVALAALINDVLQTKTAHAQEGGRLAESEQQATRRPPKEDGPWANLICGTLFMGGAAWVYWYCSSWEQNPPDRANQIFLLLYLVGGKWGPAGFISIFGGYHIYKGIRQLGSRYRA